MGVKAQLSVEEYLHMNFDGLDCDYVDGQIVERAMPDNPHSGVQDRLIEILHDLKKKHPFHVRPELRQKVTESRYRVTDIAVFLGHRPTERYPATPPYIAIEILSPDDRYSETVKKLGEYYQWGVPHVWLIDPARRRFAVYDSSGLREVAELRLPDRGVILTAADVFESI